MTTKHEARARIAAAEKTCNKAHAAWTNAAEALAGSVSMNGCGIFNDPSELRQKLFTAEKHIKEALHELAELKLPSNADYDQL